MRLYGILSLVIYCNSLLHAQNGDPVFYPESKIQDITIYLSGASIHRQATFNLSAGRSKIILKGLSPNIDPNSMQAMVSNNAHLLAISKTNDFVSPKPHDVRMQKLKDSLAYLHRMMEKTNAELGVYNEEKRLLSSNVQRIGEKEGVKTLELTSAANFYRSRLLELNDKIFLLNEKLQAYKKTQENYSQQLSQFQNLANAPTSTLELIVQSDNSGPTTLDIRYLETQSAWQPQYDLHTKGTGSNIKLSYKGLIINQSGETWDKAKLTLSTAEPNLSLDKPVLQAWTLNFSQKATSYEGLLNTSQLLNNSLTGMTATQASKEYVEIEVSDLSVDYEIKQLYQIASDGIPYMVDIANYEVTTFYNHFCIPKVRKDVFLVGKMIHWESLNLLNGQANIYFDNTYIGQTTIDTRYASDTLQVFLGIDKKVSVARVKKVDYNEEKMIGLNRKEMFTYNIDVRNNHLNPIQLELIDQVPISQENEIEVEVKEISGAQRDLVSGKLTWQLSLEPAQTKKLTTSFEVKYPRNKEVNIRQGRRVICPKFK